MEKSAFRIKQINRLHSLSSQTQLESDNLTAKLLKTDIWHHAKTIGTTISSAIEVNTAKIITTAQNQGKTVYLPKTMPQRKMVFLPYDREQKLITSKFGIPEPPLNCALITTELDLLLVPGIGFALDSNYRIGFGGGYYDRFLKQFTGTTIALVPTAMSFTTTQWPLEQFDVPMQQLITI